MKGRPWTIYIEEKMMERVRRVAEARQVSLSCIVREALERFLEEEKYNQARRELLEWLKGHEVGQERKQELLKAWEDYQAKERRKERNFVGVFSNESRS